MDICTTKSFIATSIACGLLWGSISHADEQRYVSIRNTDQGWVQGTCTLVFQLDNGGMGAFAPLSLTLRLSDKAGNVLGESTLTTPPFGDSDATRTIDAATEVDCEAIKHARLITVLHATEQRNDGTVTTLPLSLFHPKDYQPLTVTVAAP